MITLVLLWNQATDRGGSRVWMTQVRLTRPLEVSRNISGPPSNRVSGAFTVSDITLEMWGLVDT